MNKKDRLAASLIGITAASHEGAWLGTIAQIWVWLAIRAKCEEMAEGRGAPLLLVPTKTKTLENESYVEGFSVDVDDDFVGAGQRRSTSLWLRDALLLCVDHLQIFAVILSLSLGWPWPLGWIRATSFVLALNLDAWELTKIHTVYQGQTHAFEDPNHVPFSYLSWGILWLVAAVSAPVILLVGYSIIPHVPYHSPVKGTLLRVKIVRWFLLIVRLFTIPFGLVVVRLFACRSYTNEDIGGREFRSTVLRDTQCWSVGHLLLLLPLLLVFLTYFLAVPIWMIYKIRKELISPILCTYHTWRAHEHSIRLIEAEYVQGLDITWATHHYHMFSSYHHPWVWFSPLSLLTKNLLVVMYGTLYYATDYQTTVLLVLVGICFLATVILPVYRLFSFDVMIIFSIFINFCNLLIGMLVQQGMINALLIGQSLTNTLLVLNVVWLSVAVLWGLYLAARSSGCVAQRLGPLWPVLAQLDKSSDRYSEHTKKFFKQMLKSRKVLERCYSAMPYFAPVHELSTQIQIVNAFYREAEYLEDPTHQSLWALLDEMIDTHRHLAPHSIYGTSLTGRVPHSVRKLMEVMPAFRNRLDDREIDLVLWTPLKKRLLLKLLAISAFNKNRNTRMDTKVANTNRDFGGSVNTLALMQDDSEERNDDFLRDLDKWEEARFASVYRLSSEAQSPYPSSSSLRSNRLQVPTSLEEDGVCVSSRSGSSASIGRQAGGGRSTERCKSSSSREEEEEEVFLRAEELEREAREFAPGRLQRPARSAHLNSSRLRITLDTISESEPLLDEQYA